MDFRNITLGKRTRKENKKYRETTDGTENRHRCQRFDTKA